MGKVVSRQKARHTPCWSMVHRETVHYILNIWNKISWPRLKKNLTMIEQIFIKKWIIIIFSFTLKSPLIHLMRIYKLRWVFNNQGSCITAKTCAAFKSCASVCNGRTLLAPWAWLQGPFLGTMFTLSLLPSPSILHKQYQSNMQLLKYGCMIELIGTWWNTILSRSLSQLPPRALNHSNSHTVHLKEVKYSTKINIDQHCKYFLIILY